MNANTTQQEVLLIMGTSFSANQACGKDESDNKRSLTEKEQMEEACWNGLLPGILPELFSDSVKNKQLYLWEVREGNSFLELELGEAPGSPEKEMSIDPYLFVPAQILS